VNSDTDYYQYDLTQSLSGLTNNGQWNNITIPVGKNATGWVEHGTPSWSSVSSLVLSLNYPSGSSVKLNIGALLFHGQFQSLAQLNGTALAVNFLQQYALQFVFTWFLLTGLMYLFFRAMKKQALWKPLFIAVGMALFVMVIRALVFIVASLTLQNAYFSFDLLPGLSLNVDGVIFYPQMAAGTLFASSQANVAAIAAASTACSYITLVMFVVSYVWLGALLVMIMGEAQPEVSMPKRVAIAVVSIAVTLLALLFLSVGA
jgi:hypothetical protein